MITTSPMRSRPGKSATSPLPRARISVSDSGPVASGGRGPIRGIARRASSAPFNCKRRMASIHRRRNRGGRAHCVNQEAQIIAFDESIDLRRACSNAKSLHDAGARPGLPRKKPMASRASMRDIRGRDPPRRPDRRPHSPRRSRIVSRYRTKNNRRFHRAPR